MVKTSPTEVAAAPDNGIDMTTADEPATDPTDADLERVAGGFGSAYTGGVRRAREDTEGDGFGLVVIDPGGTPGVPPVGRTRRSGGEGA